MVLYKNILYGSFTTDDVGNIFRYAEWDGLLPYAGIAFGRAVPKTGFGFGLELGVYYDSDGPTMSLDATGMIEETKNQEALLQESFKENKFLPYASLRFAYSFKKKQKYENTKKSINGNFTCSTSKLCRQKI